MGRKKKYYTKEEKRDAQRKWQMDHYERNKAKILKKAKERYKLKKLEETSYIGNWKKLTLWKTG